MSARKARSPAGAGPEGVRTVGSPLGPLVLRARGGRLVGIDLPAGAAGARARTAGDGEGGPAEAAVLARAAGQLEEYFAGRRRRFELPLGPEGTPFQRAAWEALLAIPYGETRSYGAQAAAIGRPRAVRAVGAANGANPLPIVIPCHRVVGADGSLTGYGGGVEAKRILLALEGAAAT